ncbi:MAG: helix-turn-helix domain-containing protein [Pseudomonadota bacterium]
MSDFKALFQESRSGDEHWMARATQEFTEDLHRLMQRRAISKAELARSLGSSPAYITKVLRGDANFTVRSMVRLARALDGRLVLHLEAEEDTVRWFDILGKSRQKAPHNVRGAFADERQLRLTASGRGHEQAGETDHDPVAA